MTRRLNRGIAAGLATALVPATAWASEGGLMDPHTGTMFWTAVCFFVTFAVLGKFAWKPMLAGLQAREESIRKALEQSEKARKDAEAMLQQYQAQLATARDEAHTILEEGKKDAVVVRERIVEEARSEADAVGRRALQEIQLAKEAALEHLRDATAALSLEIAAKVLGRAVTPADHERLISETIEKHKTSRAGLN